MDTIEEFDKKVSESLKAYIRSQREGFDLNNLKENMSKDYARTRLSECDKAEKNFEEKKKIMVAFSARNIVNRIELTKGSIRRTYDNAYIGDAGIEGIVFKQAENVVEKYLHDNYAMKGIYDKYEWGEKIKNKMIQEIYESCGYNDKLPTIKELKQEDKDIEEAKKSGANEQEISERQKDLAKKKISIGLDPRFQTDENRQSIEGFPLIYSTDIQPITMKDLTKNALGEQNITKDEIDRAEMMETIQLEQQNSKEGVSLDD